MGDQKRRDVDHLFAALADTVSEDELEAQKFLIAEGIDPAQVVKKGLELIRQLQAEQLTGSEADVPLPSISGLEHPPPIEDLVIEAGKHGLHILDIARLSELGVSLVAKMNRRLIAFATIPERAIANLASALHRDYEAVAEYLRREPTLVPGVQYRAVRPPTLTQEQQDFFDAVQGDLTLSEEQRTRWLAHRTPDIQT